MGHCSVTERTLGRWRIKGHMAMSCAIRPSQWTSPSLRIFFVKWEVWIPQVNPFQLWNRWHHKPYPKGYQFWFSPQRKPQRSGASCLKLQLRSLTGVTVNKLFIKSTAQKFSPTCLSHSENRKPTPISSEDHSVYPPPSTSCKNAFMKSPQSQGQRGCSTRVGQDAGAGSTQAAYPRKINSGVGQSKEETIEEICPERRHFLSSLLAPRRSVFIYPMMAQC